MVAPQFTISVMFGGEKPYQLPGWTKNSSYYNMSLPGCELQASRTAWTMGMEVPRSYPLVHREADLSGEVGLWCLVGMLISLWAILIDDGLPSGDDLLVFFVASGRLDSWADNVPSRTLVDNAGLMLRVTCRWSSMWRSRNVVGYRPFCCWGNYVQLQWSSGTNPWMLICKLITSIQVD